MTYVPVDGQPWRLTMGLRPLDPARWLEVDGRRGPELRQKHRLLQAVHQRVVATMPRSEPAAAELLDAVLDHLDRHHPGTVNHRPDGGVEDVATAEAVDPGVLHPVDAAGRLVQEDLCLMERRLDSWVLTAASVCFPSRWHLGDKLGQDVSAIHGPVPGYAASLARPVESFFDRLRIDRPVWRLNWTLIDRPDLHQPDPKGRRNNLSAPPHRTVGSGGELWFRVERQTLRRLTDRPAVTFTIRTYVTPLTELICERPELADALRSTLATVPAATSAYKGWEGMIEPLLDQLRRPPPLPEPPPPPTPLPPPA